MFFEKSIFEHILKKCIFGHVLESACSNIFKIIFYANRRLLLVGLVITVNSSCNRPCENLSQDYSISCLCHFLKGFTSLEKRFRTKFSLRKMINGSPETRLFEPSMIKEIYYRLHPRREFCLVISFLQSNLNHVLFSRKCISLPLFAFVHLKPIKSTSAEHPQ